MLYHLIHTGKPVLDDKFSNALHFVLAAAFGLMGLQAAWYALTQII
jgi:hypothetical protein